MGRRGARWCRLVWGHVHGPSQLEAQPARGPFLAGFWLVKARNAVPDGAWRTIVDAACPLVRAFLWAVLPGGQGRSGEQRSRPLEDRQETMGSGSTAPDHRETQPSQKPLLPQSPRTRFVTPGLRGPGGPDRPSQRPSCVWFGHAERWGTTLLVTRDSPSIQGDVPGPDPARAPLTRRLPGGARLSGAAGGGSTLPAKVRQAERRCPRERDVPGPWLGHTRWEPTGTQHGHRRYVVPQVAGASLGGQDWVKSADRNGVPRSSPGRPTPIPQLTAISADHRRWPFAVVLSVGTTGHVAAPITPTG